MTTYTAHEILGGIYENTVKMTVSRRLRYMPYAQAGWKDYAVYDNYGITTDHCEAMYSYSSLIFTATVNASGNVFMIDTYDAKASADCSRTTSRQVTLAGTWLFRRRCAGNQAPYIQQSERRFC